MGMSVLGGAPELSSLETVSPKSPPEAQDMLRGVLREGVFGLRSEEAALARLARERERRVALGQERALSKGSHSSISDT